MIIVNQVKLSAREEQTIKALKAKAAKLLQIRPEEIVSVEILRQSIDSRKKPEVFLVYELLVKLSNPSREKKLIAAKKAKLFEKEPALSCPGPENQSFLPPVVVGMGPAGLFCALTLAKAGYCPVVLERGRSVEERVNDVEHFWQTGELTTHSNVQFGEGGAGTFSDGKLNTLISHGKSLQRQVLETFVDYGAPKDILYSYKPHIGTDLLRGIVTRMREDIKKYGGTVLFEHCLTGFLTDEKGLCGVTGSHAGEEIKIASRAVCLAIGHSARDTFRMMLLSGIRMEPKPFAMGVRIEHDQKWLDRVQYGSEELSKRLGPATYKLTAFGAGRSVYSFCMCPGGYVVNASSEKGRLTVNGMSYRDRGSNRANSAIVCAVGLSDFSGTDPLCGVRFQEEAEERMFAGGNGAILVSAYGDFAREQASRNLPATPCIKGQFVPGDVYHHLPKILAESVKEGIKAMGAKLPGFDHEEALVIGLEARTSSPVKTLRDEGGQSSIRGLFPCGEGAGYAGGITSAAVDGIWIAERIAQFLR